MEILNNDKLTKFTKLIIIGMPGAGKTTIMNKLIKKGHCCIDIDRLIEPNKIFFSQLAKTNDFKDKEHDAFKLGCLSSVFKIMQLLKALPPTTRATSKLSACKTVYSSPSANDILLIGVKPNFCV